MNIALEENQYYYNILRKSILFKDVPRASLKDLLKLSSPKQWSIKKSILDTHKTLYSFYIIISGRIKVYNFDSNNNRQLTLFILSSKDVFDVCTLINGCSHNVYYETLEKSEVLEIPIYNMKKWMDKNPLITKTFFKYLINKMQYLEESVIDACLESTPTRLAKLLIKNINVDNNKIEHISDLPHKELAQLIGTTRAVVNRHLQEFKKEGILIIDRRYIEVINIPKLLKKIKPVDI